MFVYRLFSFIVLLSIFFVSILVEGMIGKSAFLIFALLMSFGGVWEILNMFEKIERKSFKKAGALLGMATVLYAFFADDLGCPVFGVMAIMVVLCWFSFLFADNSRDYLEKVMNTLSGYVLIVVPLIPLIFIYDYNHGNVSGRLLLLYMILVTKSGDTGAYCTGTLTHKLLGNNHKIVPSISPKKSWEGTIGGLLISTLMSIILWEYMLKLDGMIIPLTAGVIMFLGGFCGDLAESVLKRISGVKDSNDIIPGMGGVLDVLDSLLLNAPLFYFIFLPLIK